MCLTFGYDVHGGTPFGEQHLVEVPHLVVIQHPAAEQHLASAHHLAAARRPAAVQHLVGTHDVGKVMLM